MTDFSKTVIYKIVCNDPEVTDVYVGHTVNFRLRRNCHKSDCNNEKKKEYNYLIYQTIRNNGGWENWSMLEVEQFPCDDVYQAIAREGYWYKELNGTLNTCVPSRTHKQYCQDHKEQVAELKKKWRQDHKEQIKEHQNKYYQDNKEQLLEKKKEKMECECGSCFRINDKARHLKSQKHLAFLSPPIV